LLRYLTNLALNNVPIGYGTATDREYAAFQRNFVETLSAFSGQVVIKPYPKHRHADAEKI
jgi:hypothetical protein